MRTGKMRTGIRVTGTGNHEGNKHGIGAQTKICRKIGFAQNLGWEMKFALPSIQGIISSTFWMLPFRILRQLIRWSGNFLLQRS